MSEKSGQHKTAEKHLRDIRCKTRRKFAPEENIRIVLEDLRGEYPFAELCHRALAHRQDQGLPEPKDGAGHGLQADLERPAKMAKARWIKPAHRSHPRTAVQGRDQTNQMRRLITPSPSFGHSSYFFDDGQLNLML